MEVNILKFDHFGRGIGKIKDKIVFVDKALPGEIVDVIITKEKKNFCEGRINEIKRKSNDRIDSVCPFYDKCGGCNFLHATYETEKDFKINKGKELIGNVDKFYETKDLNYRNKVTLHVKDNKIGFYREGTNEIVMIDYCYLLNNKINKVIHDLKLINIGDYNIGKIIIKTNQDKILLDVNGEVDNFFIDFFRYVDTIISNKKIVKGKGFLEEIIDNKKFKITSDAFFQVNKEGLENISIIIKNYLKNKKIDKVLDLYSGTSLWGILISDYVHNVECVEVNKEACINARENIKTNNIENIHIINGKVEDYIDTFQNIDLVIIDPPRSGLDKKTREYLKTIKSKYLIYVSCDMQTLKRDLEELKEIYKIDEVDLVDMFKRTYHCESVCLLCRRELNK